MKGLVLLARGPTYSSSIDAAACHFLIVAQLRLPVGSED